MNEWSPSGNYTGPGTVYQGGRSLRSQWDETEKGTKLLAANIRTMAESRNRNYQQHSVENICKTSLSSCNKLGGANGTTDPRFKRVIPPGVQNDACVGTEGKIPKASFVSDGREAPLSKLSVWNAPESKTKLLWVEFDKNPEQSKIKSEDIKEPSCENVNAAGDINFVQSQDHLNAVDKLSFNHDVLLKSVSKESLSEGTLNTERNSSLVSEEFGDELSNASVKVPSTARVKKVQHWIHDQIPKPDKKHSVITVIGQMQDPDNISTPFQEIDKRRKLVKELDKYAVCKKIIEPDSKEEIFDNVINKINNPLNNGKEILTSGSNDTSITCSHSSSKICKNKSDKPELLNKEKNLRFSNNGNGDSAVPVSDQSEQLSVKKKIIKNQTKSQTKVSYPVRGMFFSNLPYQRMFCFMIITTGILCCFAFSSIQNGTLMSFDLFNPKPKPITWYERICHWLWDFFRPSGNYKRAKQWRSF